MELSKKLFKAFILLAVFVLFSFTKEVYSLGESWLAGWSYRIPITINNTLNSNNLTDYQILVTLNTQSLISQGKMRSDCGDIRFTDSDGITLLNYWIEPNTCNTQNTKIWVKVLYIPANNYATIYVYYGNSSATSLSNGTAVFVWFDDFNDGDLGCGTLYTCGGTLPWKIANDRVYEGTYSAGSDPNIENYQDSWMEKTLSFKYGYNITFYDSVSSESCCDFLQFLIDGVEKHKISGEVGWTFRSYTGPAGTHTFRWRYYKDYSITVGADRGWIDKLIIREYTSPEPTATLGSEEVLRIILGNTNTTLIPGQNFTVNVSIYIGLNSNNIVLSCLNLPQNMSCSFNPNPITSLNTATFPYTASSTLTISSNYSSAPGIYNITILANDTVNGLTKTTNLTIYVPAEIVNVSVNQSLIGMIVGQSGIISVIARSNYGYNLQLSTNCNQYGFTCTFNPNPVSFGGSAQLTIQIPSNATIGYYNITITATDVNTNNSNSTTFTVLVAPAQNRQYVYSITITNLQNTSITGPYMQRLNITAAMINNTGLWYDIYLNPTYVGFFDQYGNPLYAQLQTDDVVNNYSIWWVNIPYSIPANQSITIYFAWMNANTQYTIVNSSASYNLTNVSVSMSLITSVNLDVYDYVGAYYNITITCPYYSTTFSGSSATYTYNLPVYCAFFNISVNTPGVSVPPASALQNLFVMNLPKIFIANQVSGEYYQPVGVIQLFQYAYNPNIFGNFTSNKTLYPVVPIFVPANLSKYIQLDGSNVIFLGEEGVLQASFLGTYIVNSTTYLAYNVTLDNSSLLTIAIGFPGYDQFTALKQILSRNPQPQSTLASLYSIYVNNVSNQLIYIYNTTYKKTFLVYDQRYMGGLSQKVPLTQVYGSAQIFLFAPYTPFSQAYLELQKASSAEIVQTGILGSNAYTFHFYAPFTSIGELQVAIFYIPSLANYPIMAGIQIIYPAQTIQCYVYVYDPTGTVLYYVLPVKTNAIYTSLFYDQYQYTIYTRCSSINFEYSQTYIASGYQTSIVINVARKIVQEIYNITKASGYITAVYIPSQNKTYISVLPYPSPDKPTATKITIQATSINGTIYTTTIEGNTYVGLVLDGYYTQASVTYTLPDGSTVTYSTNIYASSTTTFYIGSIAGYVVLFVLLVVLVLLLLATPQYSFGATVSAIGITLLFAYLGYLSPIETVLWAIAILLVSEMVRRVL